MQKATGVHVVQSGGNLRGVLEDCACKREPVELVHSARDAANAEAWEDKGVVGRMGSCGEQGDDVWVAQLRKMR
jgi:hypothetical protein